MHLSEEPRLLHEERVCIAKRGCAVLAGLGKGVQCDERVCIPRRATFAI